MPFKFNVDFCPSPLPNYVSHKDNDIIYSAFLVPKLGLEYNRYAKPLGERPARLHGKERHLLPSLLTPVDPWDVLGGKRDLTPAKFPLSSTCLLWDACLAQDKRRAK